MRVLTLTVLCCAGLHGQVLTLEEAQETALRNHPALRAARFGAAAAGERITENEAAKRPIMVASLTGAGAADRSRIAAGALNNPVIYSRLATGVTVSQTLYDFGRTNELVAGAKSAAEAENARVNVTRADVLLLVQRSYFASLRSRMLVGIARSTVEARQVVVDQVTALVNAKLKSGLDQRFASTSLAEAKLLLSTAENEYRASQVALAEAMGYSDGRTFELRDVAMTPMDPAQRAALIAQALRDRPELEVGRQETESARRIEAAEKALRYPTISAIAAAGVIPAHVEQLKSGYVAGGVNVSLPFLNGGLFKAREREAAARASQLEQRVKQLENAVSRDVDVAMLDVATAEERIGLTEQLVLQANEGMELAQSRYELGLSSIVELTQAQLAKTNAEIQQAAARYDYQTRRAILDHRLGRLR